MRFTYQHNGQSYSIELEAQPDGRYQARIADRVYTVEALPLSSGGWRLQLTGESGETQRASVYSASEGGQRFLSLEGEAYTLTVPDKRTERKRASGGGGDLTAQMPGQVVNVLVTEGETVERGQTLMLLEAMKMEIRVAAPNAGRVKRLLVKTGQVVERGQRLLEIESSGD